MKKRSVTQTNQQRQEFNNKKTLKGRVIRCQNINYDSKIIMLTEPFGTIYNRLNKDNLEAL